MRPVSNPVYCIPSAKGHRFYICKTPAALKKKTIVFDTPRSGMGYLVSFCGWLLICSFALLRKTMLTCCSLLKNVPAMGFKIIFLSDTHKNHESFLQLETIQWSLIFPCYTFHRFGRGTHRMKRFVKICALSCSSCQRINKGTH